MTEASNADGEWMTTEEFASLVRVEPATCRNWRRDGYGPAPVPFGRKIRYRRTAVVAWIATREALAEQGQAELADCLARAARAGEDTMTTRAVVLARQRATRAERNAPVARERAAISQRHAEELAEQARAS